jgi:hypothetical protein
MVFQRARQIKEIGFDIRTLLGLRETKGDIGIEVEVEGSAFPKPAGMEAAHKPVPMPEWKYWSYVKDGSLRGDDNAEYVLTKPILFDEVGDAVVELAGRLADFGSKLDESNRTSVHIHLNCQKFHANRLASFTALYFCFEELLTEWCGDHRVGNLFCLRGKDAPGLVTRIKKFIKYDGKSELSDGLHYSGLNANALNKFGSLEVRTLRGPTDFSVIEDWVGMLRRLYELSAKYEDPRDIPALFSQQGPSGFFDSVMGPHGLTLLAGISFNDQQVRESLYEGIRLAQDICYCRDWSLFEAVTVRDDPFGRSSKKTLTGLLSMSQADISYENIYNNFTPPSPHYAYGSSPTPPEYEEVEDGDEGEEDVDEYFDEEE